MIRLENITKVFNTKQGTLEAVKDVTLAMMDGEIFGIIGFSGAGKSTLVRCINLLERPSSGRVFIGDVELTALGPAEVRKFRKRIGMVFQQFNLFPSRTVSGNVAFPISRGKLRGDELKRKVTSLLELVDLAEKADAYPGELSGGQKQRVGIARALASDPEILLCDEATSALDPQKTHDILMLLKKLNRELGITIVLITHEMQAVKEICDRVAVMEGGSVVEEGDVFSVFSNPTKAITRDFIDTTSNLSRVRTMLEERAPFTRIEPGQCILQLKYLDRSSSEPVVSYLSRTYGVDLNIIFGNIEMIGERPIGGLVVIASGEAESIGNSINYLKNINVGVEVMLDARVTA